MGERGGARRAVSERPMFQLFAVSAVVMGLAHTIAKERMFEPVRRALGGQDTWLGYLVSCPYCASHWIAFAIVPLTGAYDVDVVPLPGPVQPIVRWFLSSILVTVLAAFLRVGFYFFDETQGLVRREQRKVEVETDIEQKDRHKP
jgi:hypothetical protein